MRDWLKKDLQRLWACAGLDNQPGEVHSEKSQARHKTGRKSVNQLKTIPHYLQHYVSHSP